jgi:hypothetical protein
MVSLLVMLPTKHYRDAAIQKKTTIVAREETWSFFHGNLPLFAEFYAWCNSIAHDFPAVEGKLMAGATSQQTWLSSLTYRVYHQHRTRLVRRSALLRVDEVPRRACWHQKHSN